MCSLDHDEHRHQADAAGLGAGVAAPSGSGFGPDSTWQPYVAPTFQWPTPKRWPVVATGAVLGGLTALVTVFDPRTHTVGTCPMLLIFGLQCPACGATRATHLMLHGQILEAMHYNVLWVVLFPICLYALVAWALHAFARKPVIPRIYLYNWIPNAVLIAMVVFGVVRNLPFEFLHVLNPPL